MKIAIIDSGLCDEHIAFNSGIKVSDVIHFFKTDEGLIAHDNMVDDYIGHGTSVAAIINKYAPQAELVIIKIFDAEDEPDEDILIFALRYIYEQIECDLINISAGISRCTNINEMKQICDRIIDRGTQIIAAFDNDGSLSYPAAFSRVIGVDWSLSCFSPTEYYYIEKSPINIRGMGYSQLLPCTNNTYIKQSGASFVAPIITGMLCAALSERRGDFNVWDFLRSKAKGICCAKDVRKHELLRISRAIVISFSKETRPLLEFSKLLPFEICGVYDFRHCGRVGRQVIDYFSSREFAEDVVNNISIKSIGSINWLDDFDTVIIGHTNMVEKVINDKDFKNKIIENCQRYGKQIYMYDSLGVDEVKLLSSGVSNNLKIRIPLVSEDDIPRNQYGKLYQLNTPVLGIFGTGPRQGKFTLQLKLRKHLQDNGYRIGNLGTEPESELFGFEGTYPMGYNSMVRISGGDAITYINSLMHKIELTNPDLIIVGSQSNTVENSTESLGYMNYIQHELVLGSQPDAYVLCVNYSDDLSYIERTINYLQSVTFSKVISIAVFPVVYQNTNGYLNKPLRTVPDDEMSEFVRGVENYFRINTYSMNDKGLLCKLQNDIEVYFSGGENIE